MTQAKFGFQLLIFSLLWLPCMLGLHYLPLFAEDWLLSILSLLFFILGSQVLFVLGKRSAQSANKQAFTEFFLKATMLKMLLSLIFLAWYWLSFAPKEDTAILLFFLPYFWFTLFEIRFLSQVAKDCD